MACTRRPATLLLMESSVWARGLALDCLLDFMLVIHWAKHKKTTSILSNGIRPSYRRRGGSRRNPKGVYVYPFSRNKTLVGNWRRNLKTWDTQLGNYNGFIFRLVEEDFPLIAGYWFFNRSLSEESIVPSLSALAEKYGDFFSGEILNPSPEGVGHNWEDFEIVIHRHIEPRRIVKVLKDREPKVSWWGRQSNYGMQRTRN